ncbi:galactokinase [Arundinibacter roseus]|uniref:Galactokinase n=1 Tax=Arundinibacter roseus TaxID=2070510 RepID=A0A4V2XAK9_9BACT|nr:galactokinase [Arundinibacter roseus]TDB68015.1 galactokinase [Arundinibacter roseus]
MQNTMLSTADRIREAYLETFGGTPRLFRSPGRINLIGEHTDYNHGFVLPASVDKAVYFAIQPRTDSVVRLLAVDLGESYECTVDALEKPLQEWPQYQLSVLDQLQKAGYSIPGFQAAFGGDVPVGAGMSSSAALECGLLFALNEVFGLGLDRLAIVKMAQRAENEYVGVKCGIMDQFASVFGKAESVIRLDCRSLDYEYFPFPMEEYLLILCDTSVKHSLADSEYNTRRLECEQGVQVLRKHDATIESLRDSTPELVRAHQSEMPEAVFRRSLFITEEIQRVQRACELLLEGNLSEFGQKMYATHDGLQHDYEVSCAELDFLVNCTRTNDDVLGARMMGGGFGGCTINLVKRSGAALFEERMKRAYLEKYGIALPCYRVTITDGTSELTD